MMRFRKSVAWLLFFGSLVLVPAVASSYVPTGRQILSRTAVALGHPSGVVVHQTRHRIGPSGADTEKTGSEIVRIRYSGLFRTETDSSTDGRIYIESAGRHLSVVDGRVSTEAPGPVEVGLRLIANTDADRLSRVLIDAGVDLRVSSLGRFEGRIAWVVGARYPDESVPQVWFDKETFLPFRWLLTGRAGPQSGVEVRYFAWEKTGDVLYPMAMEIYREGRLTDRVQVGRIEPGVLSGQELFDIDRLTLGGNAGAAPRPGNSELNGGGKPAPSQKRP